MELQEKLEKILRSHLSEPKFRLETSAGGSVGGLVTSGSFDGCSQLDRQTLVWDWVKKGLADAEQANIIYLLTLTPDEEEDASQE